jgi:hypothetical protein
MKLGLKVAANLFLNTVRMGALLKRRLLTDVVLVASDGRELAAHKV